MTLRKPTNGVAEVDVIQTKVFGEPAPKAAAKLAFFDLTPGVQLELIEPNHEPSVWRDHLDKYGEGIHQKLQSFLGLLTTNPGL